MKAFSSEKSNQKLFYFNKNEKTLFEYSNYISNTFY